MDSSEEPSVLSHGDKVDSSKPVKTGVRQTDLVVTGFRWLVASSEEAVAVKEAE